MNRNRHVSVNAAVSPVALRAVSANMIHRATCRCKTLGLFPTSCTVNASR
jgi:hypothetical protein